MKIGNKLYCKEDFELDVPWYYFYFKKGESFEIVEIIDYIQVRMNYTLAKD